MVIRDFVSREFMFRRLHACPTLNWTWLIMTKDDYSFNTLYLLFAIKNISHQKKKKKKKEMEHISPELVLECCLHCDFTRYRILGRVTVAPLPIHVRGSGACSWWKPGGGLRISGVGGGRNGNNGCNNGGGGREYME